MLIGNQFGQHSSGKALMNLLFVFQSERSRNKEKFSQVKLGEQTVK